jgi:serine/threonine-protein kinase
MGNAQQPGSISRADFVNNLGSSGLFTPEEMAKALEAVSAAADEDGQALAQRLTAAGKLTAYQAEALRHGRSNELVVGVYEILDRLGAGGMGTVYKARHRRMKRVVAIKVLARDVARDPLFLHRFQREVETVAQLHHPNIVMAYDAGETEAGPFLVMEFVDGRDLATRVEREGALPLRDAVDCTLQAARGLVYAHAQSIVHRDIKPANLLQDVSGVVKVADLGLARLRETRGQAEPVSGAVTVTQAGSVVGTVDYMPPEQAEDSTATDHRADIYSLGCTLYFLLTGKPPYVGQSLMSTLLKHAHAPVPSLRAARPEVPAALDVLFRHMVAKWPDDRCQSMAEVVRALETVLAACPVQVAPAARPAAAALSAGPADAGKTDLKDPALTVLIGPGNPASSATVSLGPSTTQDPPSTKVPAVPRVDVLLVEPSRTQSVIVRKYLQDLGIVNVQAVGTGQKALDALHAARTGTVITAMHLPDLTGARLAEMVRAEPAFASVGLVVVSSEADAPEATAVRGLPRTVLLAKPFSLEQLARALCDVAG